MYLKRDVILMGGNLNVTQRDNGDRGVSKTR